MPKTPAQAYRESTAEIVAYNAGVVLRIIWEVAKPIIGWVAVVLALGVASIFVFLWKALFSSSN